MKRLFLLAALALTLGATAPQQASAKGNPAITVINKNLHTEISVNEYGYYWWVKDGDGNTILCGYTDTSGKTQSAVWN